MDKLKKIIIFSFALKKLYEKNKKRKFSLSLKSKIYSWVKGFLPESYIIYDLKNKSYLDYLSDLDRVTKTNNINKENSILIDNKLLFAINFMNDKIVLPQIYINRNSIIDLDNNKIISKRDLLLYIKNQKEYVIKPEGGGGGFGIYFIKYSEKKWYLNEERKEEGFIASFLSSLNKSLIYERIEQTGIASKIYSNSLNTIRLLTMVDPITNEPFIASAVFRCGTSKTKGVDNWSSGGLSSDIDIESGILGKAVTFPQDGKLKWKEYHPDSKFKIEGCIIPNWDIIKKDIIELSKKHFYLPYIGWDIISMENDYMILEANSNSDINLLQVHKPLLLDEKVKNFYKYYKVI